MKRKILILTSIVLTLTIFTFNGTILAKTIFDYIRDLDTTGKESSEYLDHVVIDLSNLQNSSVTTSVYQDVYETKTIEKFAVQSQPQGEATDKLTRYMFELTNRYRPKTNIALTVSQDRMTVNAYVYGEQKERAMSAIVYGITDTLGNKPISKHNGSFDNDVSWVEKYNPVDKIDKTNNKLSIFSILKKTYTINENTFSVDVEPDITESNDVFVPIRFFSYAVGLTEEQVKWDNVSKTVTINKDDSKVILTLNSNIAKVNNEERTLDYAPYLKSDRTMLHLKSVSELLNVKTETTDSNEIEIYQEQE